jgi:predicted lactoylglutathione lyase
MEKGRKAVTATMNRLEIVVSDMDASTAFYERLGLTFTVDPRMADHASCDLPNGMHLMLDTEKFVSTYTPDRHRGAGSPPVFLAFQFRHPSGRGCQAR